MIADMLLIFIAEITNGAQYGIGSRLSQTAQSGVFDNLGHFFQKLDVAFLSLALGNIG